MDILFTVDKVNYCGLNKKKKKKRERKTQCKNAEAKIIAIQTRHIVYMKRNFLNS